MKLLRRLRKKQPDSLEFTEAAQPPWAGVTFLAVLGFFAALATVGVRLPPSAFPLLIPFLAGIAAVWIVGRFVEERSLYIVERDGGHELGLWTGHRHHELRLRELASVMREEEGAQPAVTLTDLRGSSVVIPLGIWADEPQLMEAIEQAAMEAGATGSAGSAVGVYKPWWVGPARVGLFLVTLVPMAVLIGAYSPSSDIEPVPPERIEETQGRTLSPFGASGPCDIYVVPVDRPSEERAAELVPALERLTPVDVCLTDSLRLTAGAVEPTREQVVAQAVLEDLVLRYRARFGDRPATILGVSELDMFSVDRPDWRFVFGSRYFVGRTGFGAISTARMGSGADRSRRLETMAMRYVGFLHFGLPESSDPRSALYPTILSLQDLDRLETRFSDPPPSDAELAAARARFLRGG